MWCCYLGIGPKCRRYSYRRNAAGNQTDEMLYVGKTGDMYTVLYVGKKGDMYTVLYVEKTVEVLYV